MLSSTPVEHATFSAPRGIQTARLGLICSLPVTPQGDKLLVNHAVGRLLEALAERVPGTKLCIPLVPEPSASRTHELAFKRADITFLPPLASVIASQRYHFQTRRIVRDFARSLDVLFMRVPFQLPTTLRRLGKPKLMHVVSNPAAVIDASSDYGPFKKRLAQRFARHSVATMRRMAAEPHTRVASNGSEMYDVLEARAGRVVVSSCLYEHEMRPRESLALGHPPRLLFVGYLRPEKGIDTLLDAFDRLRARRPLKLTLVGGVDKTATHAETATRCGSRPARFATTSSCAALSSLANSFSTCTAATTCTCCPAGPRGRRGPWSRPARSAAPW